MVWKEEGLQVEQSEKGSREESIPCMPVDKKLNLTIREAAAEFEEYLSKRTEI